MNKIILIPTTIHRQEMLQNVLASIKDNFKYPVLIVKDVVDGTETLEKLAKTTSVEEILILHDTVEVKKIELLDLIFETHAGKSVAMSEFPCMFGMGLGKFRTEIIKKLMPLVPTNIFPNGKITTKRQSSVQEIRFGRAYHAADPTSVLLFQNFRETHLNKKEFKFGRENMILENEFIKKYKGSWNPDMCDVLDRKMKSENALWHP